MAFFNRERSAWRCSCRLATCSSTLSRLPDCSPAAIRLQYSASKYRGCRRKASARLQPAPISVFSVPSRRISTGLLLLWAITSSACNSATPEQIKLASWRLNWLNSRLPSVPCLRHNLACTRSTLSGRIPRLRNSARSRAGLRPLLWPLTSAPCAVVPCQL
ncbi:hypothetical protein D3C75_841510 [compost metagenome]